MKKELAKILEKTNALPVLFIGSGLTRRYLDLPDWESLLKRYCIKKPFEYYNDKAARECRTNPDLRLPTAADFIEADYNEAWYTLDEYADSREKHKVEMEAKISPLKICMAEYFLEASTNPKEEYADEIERLKKIGEKNVSCIITTNYDCFLENCFGEDRFTKYIGQDDLLFSTTYEVGELYKIHGCCTKPESIVINADDYNKMQQKSAYLSAKILTMFLERPIIFLGYGINDSDIKTILESISACLENEQLEKLKERLIFIEWNNKPEEKAGGISERKIDSNNGKTISMHNVVLTNYADLYDAILENKVKYDIKILRKIKSELYELIKENKPTDNLHVATDLEDDVSGVEFVVGVGVYSQFGEVGYRGIKSSEYYYYLLGVSEKPWIASKLLEEGIPYLRVGKGNVPVCRLISQCISPKSINAKVLRYYKKDLSELFSQAERDRIRKRGYKSISSIMDYYEENGLYRTLQIIPLLNPKDIDLEEFYQFLVRVDKDHPGLLDNPSAIQFERSQYKKCVNIWDWLKYHERAEKKLKDWGIK